MVQLSLVIGILVVFLFLLVVILVAHAKRNGYFTSIKSLRFKLFVSQMRRTPFRLLTNLLSRFQIGEILVTRFRGVVKGIVLGILFIAVSSGILTSMPGFETVVVEYNLTSKIDTIWQVHATLSGFSVVALVFVWEALQSEVQTGELIGELTEKQGLLDRIYFLIIANLFIGAGALITSPLSPESTVDQTPTLLQILAWTSVIQVLGYLLFSAWELLKYYEDIHSILFRKGPDQIAMDVYRQKLEDAGEKRQVLTYQEIIEKELDIQLSPYIPLISHWGTDNVVRISAEEIDAKGKRTMDINLAKLETAIEIVGEESDISLWYNLDGRPRDSTSIMRAEAEIPDSERARLVEQLRDSYKFHT